MRTFLMFGGVFLFLLISPTVNAYAYDGYSSGGYDYPGQWWDLTHYETSYRYGYATGYDRYHPGTWTSGQYAYNSWPSQWGITPRYGNHYPTYSTPGYHGGSKYPIYFHTPTTHSRYIPGWKYPLYYGNKY